MGNILYLFPQAWWPSDVLCCRACFKSNMAVCRALLRRSQFFSCFYHNKPTLPSLSVTRTCFNAPGSSEEENFEEMFRNSRFVKMGRPQGKTVVGKITHIVQHEDSTDLYVDFGWKFHTVCTLMRNRVR